MPTYEYRCAICETMFEELVRAGETPACPHCGYASPSRLLSLPSRPGRSTATIAAARAQAAREGHLSHYSPTERSRLLKERR